MAASQRAEKSPSDRVHQDAVRAEMIRKLERNQELYTGFFINPKKKLDLIPDKPMSKKEEIEFEHDSDFIQAYQRARLEPTKKFARPQTESQEVGWVSRPLIAPDRSDRRLHFNRRCTEVTKYAENAIRSGVKP
ncbi:cilia- and flagella-associated protein 144 [Genypterus blacodes]|uniref:cilia- and flagella-associated protein 144 n=1 Tax=Genypterus blacodes TaxID=154954 RepID=UPI003F76EEA4